LRESVERLGRESSIGVLLENEASVSGRTKQRRE